MCRLTRGVFLRARKNVVLDSDPGATLGMGTKRSLTRKELLEAALNGSIEGLMDWKPVKRGVVFYIPAGTVHAIGAGVSLIEIQQKADVTYRVYDYARPHEIHLEDGVCVATAAPYSDPLQQRLDFGIDQLLVDGPLFRLRLTGNAGDMMPGSGPAIIVPIEATSRSRRAMAR